MVSLIVPVLELERDLLGREEQQIGGDVVMRRALALGAIVRRGREARGIDAESACRIHRRIAAGNAVQNVRRTAAVSGVVQVVEPQRRAHMAEPRGGPLLVALQ